MGKVRGIGGAGGAGGGTSAEEWDEEVTTLAALNAALADGARVLLGADITVALTDQINLFSGRCTIGRKPGVQIIQTGTANLFQLGSAVTCDVTLVSVGEDREKLPFIDTSGGTPTYLVSGDSGALVRLKGDIGIKANASLTLRGVCGLDVDADELTIVCPDNALTIGSATIRADRMNVVGGGSSSRLTASLSATAASKIGSVRVTGTWRQVSSSPLTEFAIAFGGEIDVGPITGSLGAAGYILIDEGVVCRRPHITQGGLSVRDAVVVGGYTPALQTATASSSTRAKTLLQGLVFDAWAYTVSPASYQNCRLPTSTPQTIGSGSEPDFLGCTVPSGTTINFSSGSRPRFDDCELDGTVVLDSGAGARITNMRDGGGTLTNNDAQSIVTGSETPSWDTTPATARFDSAVLDPIRHQLVFDYPGVTEGEPNRAPSQRAAGCIGRTTSSGASMDSGYYVSSTTGQFEGRIAFSAPSRLGFTLAFWWRPTATSTGGAEQNVLALVSTDGSFIAVNQIDNNLRVYLGSVGFYDTSTAGNLFSTSVARLVTINVRLNGSTPTMYVRVNGTQVIAAASAPLLPSFYTRLILGVNGAAARAGRFTKIQAWNIGLSNAQADELLTKPLLSGVA